MNHYFNIRHLERRAEALQPEEGEYVREKKFMILPIEECSLWEEHEYENQDYENKVFITKIADLVTFDELLELQRCLNFVIKEEQKLREEQFKKAL